MTSGKFIERCGLNGYDQTGVRMSLSKLYRNGGLTSFPALRLYGRVAFSMYGNIEKTDGWHLHLILNSALERT